VSHDPQHAPPALANDHTAIHTLQTYTGNVMTNSAQVLLTFLPVPVFNEKYWYPVQIVHFTGTSINA
jgi:hypothetical protein